MVILYNRLLTILNEQTLGSTYYCIALQMLKMYHELGAMSINQLADKCFVSKSTISKFIRKLGYEDFNEFQYVARKLEDTYHYKFSFNNNVMHYLDVNGYDSYVLAILNDIMSTYHTLDWDKVRRLVKDIYEYNTVASFGLMFSESAAMDLQYKLAYNKKFILTNINDIKQEQFIENAGEDVLIIIFSDSGEFLNKYRHIEDFVNKRAFDKTKAKIVVITSDPKIEDDPRVDYTITYKKMQDLCTHRILYGILTDMIAFEYRTYVASQENEQKE